MPTTPTQLFPPPTQSQLIDDRGYSKPTLSQWFFTLQNLLPLRVVDTSTGGYAETPPAAGLNATTGQSNQNMEIIYKKSSADGNTFTLNGVADGPQTLTLQYSFVRIKSDGTSWWVVGRG